MYLLLKPSAMAFRRLDAKAALVHKRLILQPVKIDVRHKSFMIGKYAKHMVESASRIPIRKFGVAAVQPPASQSHSYRALSSQQMNNGVRLQLQCCRLNFVAFVYQILRSMREGLSWKEGVG